MSHRTLDGLSFETLQDIGAYLHDTHLMSLHSLALVNKRCYAAAAVWLFHTLRFENTVKGKLEVDVAQCVEVLSAIDGFKYVRTIKIEGCGLDHNERPGFFGGDGSIEVGSEENESWLPLVGLLRSLPRLSDLIFDCLNQFPPSLLDALHQYQPGCRLHIMHLRFRSLLQEVPYPHEVNIATSPCLYSVRVHYTYRDSSGKDDFHEEAIRRIVSGVAPHLKELWMLHSPPCDSPDLRRSRSRPRGQWKGFPGVSVAVSKGSLTSLSLNGFPCVIQGWQDCTDFEILRHLHLSYLDSDQLSWVVDNARFPSLKELEIYLPPPPQVGQYATRPYAGRLSSNKLTLFSSLPPLQSLSLSGHIDEATLTHILRCHGNSLRELRIDSTGSSRQDPFGYGQDLVSMIRERCSNLRELMLPVRRSFSDRNEVELYRTLASIPRLTSLVLVLDVGVPSVEPRVSSSGFFTMNDISDAVFERDKAQIRKGLLNAAIDESLVRSIWDVMAGGTARGTARGTLSSLVLRPRGGGVSYGARGIISYQDVMIEQLSRSFRVEKSVRDDDDSITITDLDKDTRDVGYEREEEQLASRNAHWREQNYPIPRNRILDVFRSIWPAKESSRDWRDDWESLPLDRGG